MSRPSLTVATNKEPVPIQRLELSLDPETGALLTAPLSNVLLAATNDLYNDIYNMAHGELDVTVPNQVDENNNNNDTQHDSYTTQRDRLSNLSFAQRRHEISWRLAQHGRGLQHVAALTAAAATSDLSQTVRVSTAALQHARTAWVQADEAQDALYFFHAQLFPARAAPHDVYGALDVQLAKHWFDLPNDICLSIDRYEMSPESALSKQEIDQKWQMAVREKLITGEVAMNKNSERLWKLSLNGGVVKLSHGNAKMLGNEEKQYFPIEALLTVLSTGKHATWTLLSLEVRVQAKTGEFNHQLETSNRQRYNLHRLAALAMTREEIRAYRENESNKEESTDNGNEQHEIIIAQPLESMFKVAHQFSLSWQLEILSAQAQALRRGAWGANESSQLTVTPVKFYGNEDGCLGSVTISFWRVDDSYGTPSMATIANDEHDKVESPTVTNQLSLSIRAIADFGMTVALSGAESIKQAMETDERLRSIANSMISAASDPFALSASDALLGATRLCAERKCHAVVEALLPVDKEPVLPPWISVQPERGGIVIASKVQYHGIEPSLDNRDYSIMFRLVCDLRTGSFVVTFPRSMTLLRRLASNDTSISESLSLRLASLPANRRRAAGANSTGRATKDAFDALVRAANALSQKTGVGGKWDDIDDRSASLRQRSIQLACTDVRDLIIRCCGMAALYGFLPLAFRTAFGCDMQLDIAGDAIDKMEGYSLVKAPPISILLDQEIVEQSEKSTTDGSVKKSRHIVKSLLSFVCQADLSGVTLIPFNCTCRTLNPSSIPTRETTETIKFVQAAEKVARLNDSLDTEPQAKRYKQNDDSNSPSSSHSNALYEASNFATILDSTLKDMITQN